MKFYFPDSHDQVSPTYDFLNEEYSSYRVRQRDDKFAHEILSECPYDGLLVSKYIVDGAAQGSGRYTSSQRERFYEIGVERYFRLPAGVATLGDCDAFNYIDEKIPPYEVKDVVDFYERCGFQSGVSVDHVIFAYDSRASEKTVSPQWSERRKISLMYAQEFINEVGRRDSLLIPVGAAQGWSPESYADSVRRLEVMGYERIALSGVTPMRTTDILECLQKIGESRQGAEIHLRGLTRVDSLEDFSRLGVTSFDSSSPFRQSFTDDRNNYHTSGRSYAAIRVPRADGNLALKRKALSGQISETVAKSLEREALRLLRAYDRGESSAPLQKVLAALKEYGRLFGGMDSRIDRYKVFLEDRPWKRCSCGLCQDHGIELAIFRGAERNKMRGFHNLAVFAGKIENIGRVSDQENE